MLKINKFYLFTLRMAILALNFISFTNFISMMYFTMTFKKRFLLGAYMYKNITFSLLQELIIPYLFKGNKTNTG